MCVFIIAKNRFIPHPKRSGVKVLLHVPKLLGGSNFLGRWKLPRWFWDRLLAASSKKARSNPDSTGSGVLDKLLIAERAKKLSLRFIVITASNDYQVVVL
ncbi:MAG: hypothetical protein MI725_16805, partial [Pirellulales bacterium]|nr:hypothetical protein [Pirellulales bacterium]